MPYYNMHRVTNVLQILRKLKILKKFSYKQSICNAFVTPYMLKSPIGRRFQHFHPMFETLSQIKIYILKETPQKMKKRLHDKKAGIAILVALIVISLAEVIFRLVALNKEVILATPNLGEQLAVIVLAISILILTAKGKNKTCYILYCTWIGYFVLDQLFELPSAIVGIVTLIADTESYLSFAIAMITRLTLVLISLGIISIGHLVMKYMTRGIINNRVFNIFCTVTILLILVNISMSVYGILAEGIVYAWLATFNALYRIAMVFLTACFAYDVAKMQLQKNKASK
jgi:hypothetical protein